MRHLGKMGLVALALVAVASSIASAQRRTRVSNAAPAAQGGFWELGLDGGIGIGLDDPKTFSIAIPVSQVRAGYYVSDILSLEPSLSFFSVASKGSTAFSAWTLGLGVLYHLSPDRKASQMFVHPMLAFDGGSGGQDTRTSLGAGVGLKKPAMDGRFVWRFEAGLMHRLKSGAFAASTGLYGNWGLSIYTK